MRPAPGKGRAAFRPERRPRRRRIRGGLQDAQGARHAGGERLSPRRHRPGKAVTLLLPNLPETHYALLGAQAAGIASPVNPMLDVEHIVSIVNETAAEALVAFAPGLDVELWNKAVAVTDRCPSIRTLFVAGAAPYVEGATGIMLDKLAAMARLPLRGDVKIVPFDAAMEAERAMRSNLAVASRRTTSAPISTRGEPPACPRCHAFPPQRSVCGGDAEGGGAGAQRHHLRPAAVPRERRHGHRARGI